MTSSRAPRRRRPHGAMTAMRLSGVRSRRTPLWQWLVGIPLIVLIAAAILAYIYITYVTPRAIPTTTPPAAPPSQPTPPPPSKP